MATIPRRTVTPIGARDQTPHVPSHRLPDDLRRWFAGEVPPDDVPWSALLPHDIDGDPMTFERIRLLWRRYAATNPGAVPPDHFLLRAVLAGRV